MVTRIRQLLEHKQLTPTQFADAIGVGRPVMSHILSERNKPSLEVVQRIIDAFPEVSMAWLLRGTGEMLESGAMPAGAATASAKPAEPTPVASVPATPTPLAGNAVSEFPVPPVSTAVAPTLASVAPEPQDPTAKANAEPVTTEPSLPPAMPAAPILPTPAEVPPDPAPVMESPVTAAPKPFKAQRFVPTGTPPAQTQPVVKLPPAAAPAPATAFVAPPGNAPVTPGPFVPAAQPVAASATPTTPPATPVVATVPDTTLMPFFGEPGKAIRRIVIFYRDGSFSDYQPEQ